MVLSSCKLTPPTVAKYPLSQFKRGRMTNTMSAESDKRTLCYDILCRGELTSIPASASDDKEVDKYLVIISNVLAQLVAKGDKIKCANKQFRSSSGRLPPITLEAYVARLIQYAPCEKECFLAALLFMDRLSERHNFVFNSMNVHRSYLVSLLLAAKFFEDQPCDNGYFATVGGVSLQELNTMEIHYLTLIEYRVSVTQWEFNLYAQLLEENVENIGRPKIYFVAQEPTITPITPDTTNSMLRHVTPAIPMVSTST